jgi:predicted enzyme related to lactoylglutathione lyase
MCDDVHATVEKLKAKGVGIAAPVADLGWGLLTHLELPDGSRMGLYQPRHPAPSRA